MKIAFITLLCSGCFVLPKTTTTTKDLGTETGDVSHGTIKKIGLQAELRDDYIDVAATAERECARPVYRVTEVKTEKHASYRGNKDARAGLFALLLAPVTIPITALGTGIAVLADGDGSVTRKEQTIGTQSFTCTTVLPSIALNVMMPSGAVTVETTDEVGVVHVRIPETEPYTGVVKVITSGAETELRYTRAMPAITAVRETVMTCSAVHHVTGMLKVELDIDVYGKPAHIGLDAGDRLFERCVNEGLAKARFSDAHRSAKLVLPFELGG